MTPTPSTHDVPPPFEPTNVIDLVSVDDSKIINVNLYSGRAEITRLYKFTVRTGQNELNVNGLPNAMDRDSLRVEGRGAATIHDVTLSDMPRPDVATTSAPLEELLTEKELAERGLVRCKKGLTSLEAYLSTMDVQHTGVTDLDKIIEQYDSSGEKLDKKTIALEKRIKSLEEEIKAEREKITGAPRDDKLRVKAAISVFAASGGEVQIALIYAVQQATWSAGYDIRVDMESKEKPVTLIYKASITQSTGESWDDVPLTLDTASPTFGVEIPKLAPWNLSIYKPALNKKTKQTARKVSGGGLRMASISPVESSRSRGVEAEESDDEMGFGLFDGGGGMEHRGLSVSSKGGVSATFRIPGSITVPSDGASHNVTVVQLKLDASMTWVTVPKVDAKTHLEAKIKNASDYTLLNGVGSAYVDGSFISRSDVPLVSPQESFECPLGLDPSIRVTYHPRVQKVSHSGFYSKNSNQVFSQRITVFNTKSTAVKDFKVVDQMPVSENSLITVKLLSPALSIPENPITTSSNGSERKPLSPVKVADGVVAQWEGADEPGFDLEALGKDGKLSWVCSIPAQGKVNLLLSWEVSAPARVLPIYGL
ncbi:Protein F37C4.5 [Hypsizygus marmoreus]|uniref:Protein F37C4.5 n=1 Tax=Hypsizygus marmoreus TaxID=39966 RepID=A0A369J3J8_HYPMA|nr:Protein F37C4.5 [Hypsizygus marmoreus]